MYNKLERIHKKEIKYMEMLLKKYSIVFGMLNFIVAVLLSNPPGDDNINNIYSTAGILFLGFTSYYFVCSAILEGKWIVLLSGEFRFLLYFSILVSESSHSKKRILTLLFAIFLALLYYQICVEKYVFDFCNMKIRQIQSEFGCDLEIISKLNKN